LNHEGTKDTKEEEGKEEEGKEEEGKEEMIGLFLGWKSGYAGSW
jgi:hypothetical protein